MSTNDIEQGYKQCICKTCPIYPGKELLYCVGGKSHKTKVEGECICVKCPFWLNRLRESHHFCVYGRAKTYKKPNIDE